jgi:hypothetical protein
MQQFDDHLAHLAQTTSFQDTRNFRHVRRSTGLSFGEDVNKVGSHSFLGDQYFFGTVDNKVTAL